VCGWPWGEGGRFAWSAASGAGRAEVWRARRRNGAALAEATALHGIFEPMTTDGTTVQQAGRWRCWAETGPGLPPRLLSVGGRRAEARHIPPLGICACLASSADY
ncbi:MAG: hypothetical protein JNK54_08710, partial [Elusimicrobia bacterium]|nr:hypothetical protein [Elusimicrobiota bacterium]